MNFSGSLRKMITHYDQHTGDVSYSLNLDGHAVCELNSLVGSEITL